MAENDFKGHILKYMLPLLGVLFAGALIIFAPDKISWVMSIFTPVFSGLFVAYLLDSFVRMINKNLNVSRGLSVLIVYGVLIGALALFLYRIIPSIMSSINEIVDFVSSTQTKDFLNLIATKFDYEFVRSAIDQISEFGSEIGDILNKVLVFLSNWIISMASSLASSIVPVFSTIILSIYMLLEKDDLLARCRRIVFAFCKDESANYMMNAFGHANRIFKSFLVGKILDSVVVGIVTIVVFAVIGIPSALLLGTIIGFANIIPYFGPIIGAVPVFVIVLFIEPSKAIIALITIIIIGQIDANFIDPKIVGKNTGVSAFWTITSVTLGGAAFGFVGVILSVPTVVLIKTLIEESVERRLTVKGIADMDLDKIKVIGKKKKPLIKKDNIKQIEE